LWSACGSEAGGGGAESPGVWSLGKTVLKSRELAVIAAIVLGLAAMKFRRCRC